MAKYAFLGPIAKCHNWQKVTVKSRIRIFGKSNFAGQKLDISRVQGRNLSKIPLPRVSILLSYSENVAKFRNFDTLARHGLLPVKG